MTLTAAALSRATASLRAYSLAGLDKDRDEAHSIITDLILDAQSTGDQEAFLVLHQAQTLLMLSHDEASEADDMVAALSRSRRSDTAGTI